MLRKFKREFSFHAMMLPALILTFLFAYIPMGGITIAFQNFIPAKGMFGDQQWVGLGNFRYIFSMPDALNVIRNTVFISVGKMIGLIIVPVLTAILLNEVNRPGYKRVLQTVVSFPHFVSWVIMAAILTKLLSGSGMINTLLKTLGLKSIPFLSKAAVFPYTMIISDIWKEFGFSSIIYLATITNIDPQLYEAARVDGANRWQLNWHITLPGMASIIVLMSLLSLGNILNAGFDQIYNMYNPIVMDTGDIIDTFVYRMGIINFKYGVATAMGLFKSVISCILISVSYYMAYRFADYRVF
ncbi:ABC transporter permease subunit [Beduinella massiliensis]|uniref:ABC transporter permease subunit n=1 Tax=Beduinella massiliensis TaxID=1852363 RepID=UPI000C825B55